MPDAGRASSASAAPACERSARPHAPDAPRLLPSQCRPRTARPPAEPSCPHRSPDPADPGCTPEPSSPPPPRSRGLARFIPAVNPAPESETAEPALACTHYYGTLFYGLRPAAPRATDSLSFIRRAHAEGSIDDPANLATHRVWLFH